MKKTLRKHQKNYTHKIKLNNYLKTLPEKTEKIFKSLTGEPSKSKSSISLSDEHKVVSARPLTEHDIRMQKVVSFWVEQGREKGYL